MHFQFHPNVVIPVISFLISVSVVIFFLFNGKKTPVLFSYILCWTFGGLWSFGQIFELLAADKQTRWIWIIFEFSWICYMGVSWFIFCLFYSKNNWIQQKQNLLLLLVPPTIDLAVLLTNTYHHLFFAAITLESLTLGPLFWVHAIMIYSFALMGMVLLMGYTHKTHQDRKSVRMIIVVSLIPLLTSIFYYSQFFNLKFNPTPASFMLSFLILTVAVFRYRFLKITPLANRNIIHNMSESVIVVDDLNQIADYNRSFKHTFLRGISLYPTIDINVFISQLKTAIIDEPPPAAILEAMEFGTGMPVSGELNALLPEPECFFVKVEPVFSRRGKIVGRVISFNNITLYKNLVEELAVSRERNRFARDVHDTLGQTLTLLATLIDVSNEFCAADPIGTQSKLTKASDIIREGLKELRHSVANLKSEKLADDKLIDVLNAMIVNYQISGMNVHLSIDPNLPQLDSNYANTVYRICQEALTNALRHGKASEVNLLLRFGDHRIKLFIFDNGQGCRSDQPHQGFGLRGMKERVVALNGTIAFGSDGENGFNLHVEIPYKAGI